MKHVVCFDIGGTNVKYGIMNFENHIIEKSHFKTTIENGQIVLDQMCGIIEEYKNRFEVVGITISCPGFINTKTGVIEAGIIIEGFMGFNIKNYFENKYQVLVTVENDANCATIAEHGLGHGEGYENLVVVTLGTGVGGGLIINNKIHNGNKFMAGEYGFMLMDAFTPQDVEAAMFSNHGSTRSLIEKTSKDLGRDINGLEIFNEAALGNVECQKNIELFYDYVARGIYNICYIINPDQVLIGGAISEQPELINEITKRIDSYTPSFAQSLTNFISFDRCKFLNDAGLIGSYCNFKNQYR